VNKFSPVLGKFLYAECPFVEMKGGQKEKLKLRHKSLNKKQLPDGAHKSGIGVINWP